MMKSKPNYLAPPIPHTLELDEHTRQFFDPGEWSGPVDARFKLEDSELTGLVFIGRAATLCTGAVHLVLQIVTEEPEYDGRGPCLLAALPFMVVDFHGSDDFVSRYFRRHLNYPGNANAADWWSRVPTLGGPLPCGGLRRLHFDAGTGVGLALAPQGAALLDLRDEGQMSRGEWPYIELGDALFDFEPQTQPLRAFVALEDAQLHARVEAMLGSSDEVLGSEVRFFAMNEEERYQFVFGCERARVESTLEMLWLALILELGIGGALEGESEATWHPWDGENLVAVEDVTGKSWGADIPEGLREWQSVIEEKLGYRVRDEVQSDEEGLHTLAREWVGKFRVTAEKPSAHELLEAELSLREMLK